MPHGATGAGSGSNGSPLSSRSTGTLDTSPAPHTSQLLRCRPKRLRHSGSGSPIHRARMESRLRQCPEVPFSARTMERHSSICSRKRWTRTAACRSDSPRDAASSARVSSSEHSSHHSASRVRSESTSQRVASATSRRWSVSPSRRMVSEAKSEAGSATWSMDSSGAVRSTAAVRACSRSRIWRTAIATAQERKASGSRRPGRPRTIRTSVSCTTSSTSLCPSSARPTTL
ncbi:hypothetical protein QR77_02065 [Streptomyces sp. 150FB]|nr:hypothetical protein QR77_02065 [Streptomyces sp. 150FB]